MDASGSGAVRAEVAELDAAGKHDEAINVLALAAQRDDMTAMITLAKRLLVGDRAPYLPRDGARLAVDAANRRNAEAVALLAVFQCTGVFQQKDWGQALRTLAMAAALGWQPAREQLVLLAGEGEPATDATLTARDDPAHWTGYPSGIDPDRLFDVPAGEVVHPDPYIKSVAGLLPGAWCRLLIRLAAARLKPALKYDAFSRQNYRSETRTNSIAEFNLVENDLLHFVVQERMSRACGVPISQMEGTAVLHYRPGQQISNHYDFVDPALPDYAQEVAQNGQRIITFLIYLNDDYEGGDTAFPKLGVRHRGGTGDGLFFVNVDRQGQPDLRTLHAGQPPTAGEKWIVSQFVRDRVVKYVLQP